MSCDDNYKQNLQLEESSISEIVGEVVAIEKKGNIMDSIWKGK